MKTATRSSATAALALTALGAGASAANAAPLVAQKTYTAGGCTVRVTLDQPQAGYVQAYADKAACAKTVPGFPKVYVSISKNGVQQISVNETMLGKADGSYYLKNSKATPWFGADAKGTRWQACAVVTNSNGVWVAGGCTDVWVK